MNRVRLCITARVLIHTNKICDFYQHFIDQRESVVAEYRHKADNKYRGGVSASMIYTPLFCYIVRHISRDRDDCSTILGVCHRQSLIDADALYIQVFSF